MNAALNEEGTKKQNHYHLNSLQVHLLERIQIT